MKDAVITTIAAFGLVGCLSFIIAYHRRSGGMWRHNEIGIWLIMSRINLGLIFALLIFNRIFGDATWRENFIIFLTGLFALQTFWPSKFIWGPRIYGIQPRWENQEQNSDSRT